MNDSSSTDFTLPWHAVEQSRAEAFVNELHRELAAGHALFGEQVVAIAFRQDCDDVLFRFGQSPGRYAVVHLTGEREVSSTWPIAKFFDSLGQFVETRMKQDSINFESE
jgi:hypothetical protein